MHTTATLKYLRIAPRKVRVVADLLRGMDYDDAQAQLAHLAKRSAHPLAKLLESAASNGQAQGLVKSNLYIKEIRVNEGPTLKRFKPKGFGSAMPIAKRTSHVVIVLDERVEGMRQEVAQPATQTSTATDDTAATATDDTQTDNDTQEKESKKFDTKPADRQVKQVGKKSQKEGGFMKKMFRRKSI